MVDQQDNRNGHSPPQASGAGVEPDKPPNTAITVLLVALTVIVLGAAIGLWQVFGLTALAEIEAKDLKVANGDLLELRARDWGRLTQYESLDGGVFQIPIDRAMDKLVRDPTLIAPLVALPADAGVSRDGPPEGDGAGAGDAPGETGGDGGASNIRAPESPLTPPATGSSAPLSPPASTGAIP